MSACRIRNFVMHFYELGTLGSDQKSGRSFSHAYEAGSFSSLAICSAETRYAHWSVAQCFYLVCNTNIHLNFMSKKSQTFIWEWMPPTPGDVVGYHPLLLSCGTWPKHLHCGWSHRAVMVLSQTRMSQQSCSIPKLCSYQLQGTKLHWQSPTFQYLLYNSCGTVVRQACINTTSSWKPSKPVSMPDSVWHLDMTVNGNLQVPQMDRK